MAVDTIKTEDTTSAAEQISTVDTEMEGVQVKTEAEATVKAEVEPEIKEESLPTVKVEEQEEKKVEGKDEKKDVRERHYGNDAQKYHHEHKFDATKLPKTDDPAEIVKQVDYYFSEKNLSRPDIWLLDLLDTLHLANKPVSLHYLWEKCQNMTRFEPYSAVVAALKDSEQVNVIPGAEGEENAELVQRKQLFDPFAEHRAVIDRSVYVKGFGEEETPTTEAEIVAFFQTYGEIFAQDNSKRKSIKLRRVTERRDPKVGSFKGSVFCEFVDKETAAKFLAASPAPAFGDKPLDISSKQVYMYSKLPGIESGRTTKSDPYSSRGGRGRGRGGRGRGSDDREGRLNNDRDPNDWKKRREDDQARGSRGNRRGGDRGGRGGRGRGRGRGGNRDGPGNGDRRGSRDANGGGDESKAESFTSEVKTEVKTEAASTKRPREDDGDAGDKPAKKADTKTESAS